MTSAKEETRDRGRTVRRVGRIRTLLLVWFFSSRSHPKNRDVEYNTRAVKAARYLAWKTGDPHVIEVLYEWSRAWVDAAERTDKGKPAGVLPATIRFPDEAFNGDGSTCYEADATGRYHPNSIQPPPVAHQAICG